MFQNRPAGYLLLIAFPLFGMAAPRYKAEKRSDAGTEIVQLTDSLRGEQVSIVPSFGNRAYEFKVHGKNLLYFPLANAAALSQDATQGFNGIPFLAPWANRLSGGAFWANGKRYLLNPELGTLRVSANKIAIHGMLSSSPRWELEEVKADGNSARVTSRFVFWKYPDLLANWPFAHEYRMTYILRNGQLEIATEVINRSAEPMPVVLGYHPYFNILGTPRTEATIHIPARMHVETDGQLLATGITSANTLPDRIPLRDYTLDDGFTDLVRDDKGHATFSFEARGKKIQVLYGPKFRVGLVYAPPGKEFVCFEPMAGITNALNLAHDGKYSELQTVAPNGTWRESFWIRYEGF